MHYNALPPIIDPVLVQYNALAIDFSWPKKLLKCSLMTSGKIFRVPNANSNPINNLDTHLKEWVDMKEMTLVERKAYIQTVADEVAQGKLTLGGAVKRLRENLLGVSQERFALASKISKRALSQLEVDSGNPTLSTLEAVFKKFGLQISLAHLNPIDLDKAAAKKSKVGFGISTATPARPPFPSPSKPT